MTHIFMLLNVSDHFVGIVSNLDAQLCLYGLEISWHVVPILYQNCCVEILSFFSR